MSEVMVVGRLEVTGDKRIGRCVYVAREPQGVSFSLGELVFGALLGAM